MKFEIPLTETQRYVLRITTGFNSLPLSFSQNDLEKNVIDDRNIPDSELPAWKRALREKRKEFDRQQEKNLIETRKFYTDRASLYEEVSIGRNRGDAAIAFKNALSLEDCKEQERLQTENSRIFEEHEKITHKEVAIYRRHSSKLLGIIGIAECLRDSDGGLSCEPYNHCIIPGENLDAVYIAVRSGIFSKEVTAQDRDILRYIDKESGTSVEKIHRPSFSVVQTALDLELTNIEAVQQSFYRLTGLLCHLYLPQSYSESYYRGTITEYRDCWFIPRRRQSLIREVLGQ